MNMVEFFIGSQADRRDIQTAAKLRNRRNLSQNQQNRVIHGETLSRRYFWRQVGGAALLLPIIGGAGAAALHMPNPSTGEVHQDKLEADKNTANETQRTPEGKEYVLESIHELPDSPIKTGLVERVGPLFGSSVPSEIHLAGVPVRVWGSDVRFTINSKNIISGSSNPRPDLINTTPTWELAGDTTMFLPYVDLATANEAKTFKYVSGNDTPVIDFTAEKGAKFFNGIWPQITADFSDTSRLSRADKETDARFRKYVVVKEASTLLVYLLQLEATILEMQKLGYNPMAQVIDTDGSNTQVETVTQNINLLTLNQGRLVAAIDIAGEIFATKAYEGNQVLKEMNALNRDFVNFRQAIGKTPFNSDLQQMRRNAFNLALTTPRIPPFYQGKLQSLP